MIICRDDKYCRSLSPLAIGCLEQIMQNKHHSICCQTLSLDIFDAMIDSLIVEEWMDRGTFQRDVLIHFYDAHQKKQQMR